MVKSEVCLYVKLEIGPDLSGLNCEVTFRRGSTIADFFHNPWIDS